MTISVGERFDHFGHVYEVVKIGRDKAKTIQIARRVRDGFGKEALIDHRSFPARDVDRQHLRPLDKTPAQLEREIAEALARAR